MNLSQKRPRLFSLAIVFTKELCTIVVHIFEAKILVDLTIKTVSCSPIDLLVQACHFMDYIHWTFKVNAIPILSTYLYCSNL